MYVDTNIVLLYTIGIAEEAGLISPELTKILLTTVALSMALTPFLGDLGSAISSKLDDQDETPIEQVETIETTEELNFGSSEFVVVCGYGRVGKMVCDILDKKFIRYIAIDRSAQRVADARSKGLPVFFGTNP